ncbi:MAG: bifunctional nuclease family protein [Armatimonadetes bacterium]|nr:bifunctional nuclease family protein [Armatimonadota bacterium]
MPEERVFQNPLDRDEGSLEEELNLEEKEVKVMGEAMAISLALEGAAADRPITHDLLLNAINKLGGTVEHILIDDLWNNTYYAKVSVASNGKIIDIDSRPSDAIALSLRAKAPIYMIEGVLEKAAVKEE